MPGEPGAIVILTVQCPPSEFFPSPLSISPPKFSAFVFSILRTSGSLYFVVPFFFHLEGQQQECSKFSLGLDLAGGESGSFAEEPNAISELCGFAQIFISVRGFV